MGRSGERESESLDRHSSSRHRNDHHPKDSKRSRNDRDRRSRDQDDDKHHRSSSKSSHHKKSRRRRDRSRSPSPDSHDKDNENDSHSSNDSGSSVDSRRRDRKKRKDNSRDHHKDKKKKSKRKGHHKDEKKSKKEKKRKHKDNKDKERKHKKSRRNKDDVEEEQVVTAADTAELTEKARNYELAEALHALLVEHPTADMSINTLPLLLIKLAGGTSLDLRQMPNRSAAAALSRVLETMQTFGVNQVEHQVWKWEAPGGQRPGAPPRDERILLRIVRTLLNDIGFTMESIEEDNHMKINRKKFAEQQAPVESTMENKQDDDGAVRSALAAIENKTMKMLGKFQKKASQDENTEEKKPSTLPGELGGLCNMILEGETIALDGLPDESLRVALEELFQTCGLELCEMDDDDDDESSDEEGSAQGHPVETNGEKAKNMGYVLPEQSARLELAKAKLSSVMGACEQAASDPTKLKAAATQKRAMKGPMRMPTNYQAPEDSSDEEGPAPVGEMAKRQESAMSNEMIKRQAEMRARQLKGAVTGVDELMSTDPNQREEWMLVPGKFDFLSSIKTGNGMKSRNFQAASKAEGVGDDSGAKAVDPRVKQEMDAIMQAHADARGPTLVEQHRLNKEKDRAQKAAAAAGGGKGSKWDWNRDKDLDSGRRVDKNALNMVLGGANSDLKKKFHGGF